MKFGFSNNRMRDAFYLRKILYAWAVFLRKISLMRSNLNLLLTLSSDKEKATLMNLKIGFFYTPFVLSVIKRLAIHLTCHTRGKNKANQSEANLVCKT